MSKKLLPAVVLLGVLAGLVFLVSKSNPGDDLVVKISYRNFAGSFATLVAKDQNLFEKAGLKVEFATFVSGSESYNALVRGDIQYDPYITIIPVLLNDPKDPGKVKITAAGSLTAEEKFDQVVVKNDSPVRSLSDLSGKKIAVNPGSTASTFLKIVLKNKGIDPETVTYVQLQTKDQLISLEAGAVDAMMSYEPTTAIALDTGRYRVIHGSLFAEAFPGTPMVVRAVNGKFAAEHPGVIRKIDKVFSEAQKYAKTNPDYLHRLMAKEFNLPLSTSQKVNLSFIDTINNKILQEFIDYLYSVGELKQKVEAGSIIFK